MTLGQQHLPSSAFPLPGKQLFKEDEGVERHK